MSSRKTLSGLPENKIVRNRLDTSRTEFGKLVRIAVKAINQMGDEVMKVFRV